MGLVALTPDMTGFTSPSGEVIESDHLSEYAGWRAFDKNTFTGYTYSQWTSNAVQCWIGYDFGAGNEKIVTAYSMTDQEHDWATVYKTPRSWTLEGWNGSSWVVLDTQTDITNWTLGETKTFSIINSTAYQKYRINITAIVNSSANRVTLKEVEFFETGADSLLDIPSSLAVDTPTTIEMESSVINDLVTSDPYFSGQPGRISQVEVHYQNSIGQRYRLVFVKSGASYLPASMKLSASAKNGTWSVARIVVYDFDGGSYEVTDQAAKDALEITVSGGVA